MLFTKRLRDGIRRGRIQCTVRIWTRLKVKVGRRYRMDEGHVVVDAIDRIRRADITNALARESGFDDVEDLLQTARHGEGHEIYLIRFHYLAPGAWDATGEPAAGPRTSRRTAGATSPEPGSDLLRRIRRAVPARPRPKSRGPS
ncbi:MAG: hypothetical protein AB7O28_17680 [Vicinamibacterales bacterium]